jgi:hypothetical protein
MKPAAAPARTMAKPFSFSAADVTAPDTSINSVATLGHDMQPPLNHCPPHEPNSYKGDGKED